MRHLVELDRVRKQLKKVPRHVVDALQAWADKVEVFGMAETRKIKGYHDEPLKGDRKGQRSVRLSKQWRAIYEEYDHGEVRLIVVEEVTPHAY
jgi:proteic killer suppression protein